MTLYLQDADFTLYQGDALEILRELPSESCDCVVTSPPYWGLRDYGTGEWEGGDEGCDHTRQSAASRESSTLVGSTTTQGGTYAWGAECGRCGARRSDRQLGLEPTPEEYIAKMTEVFREVRRVLAAHGTCWLNMGDSYAAARAYQVRDKHTEVGNNMASEVPPGLKPKDLCGIPWRLAFALQADGWYLRSDIVWSKPNPMPESVTDRPTKAHEYIFLLTKQPTYFFDQEAVREDATWDRWSSKQATPKHTANGNDRYAAFGREWTEDELARYRSGGRNIRSVWEIATEPFPEAHFATFPQVLVERCLKAGCPEQVCGECGKPRERVLERTPAVVMSPSSQYGHGAGRNDGGRSELVGASAETVGLTDCGHAAYRPGIVLDPFLGSGTTAYVARRLGRRCVGLELNEDYCKMIAKRTQQLSLLGAVT